MEEAATSRGTLKVFWINRGKVYTGGESSRKLKQSVASVWFYIFASAHLPVQPPNFTLKESKWYIVSTISAH